MKGNKKFWEFKQLADAPDNLELYIYGDVECDSRDWWTGEKIRSETSANAFRDQLTQHRNAKRIDIYINSYGGSAFEGAAIYSQLKRHPAHKVVYIDGFACSIASVIAMAGDEIIMPRNALMMIHNVWQHVCGNPAELRKAADDLDIINDSSMEAYLLRAGDKLDKNTLAKMMDNETWLSAADCIKYGFADKYADQDADMSNAASVLQKVNLNVQQRISLQNTLSAKLRQITEVLDPEPKTEPKTEPENHVPTLMEIISGRKENK